MPYKIKRVWQFIIIIIAFLSILLHPFKLVVVQGTSMCPTYNNLDLLFISKMYNNLHRGDVIVFKYKNITEIKRIELIPGDACYTGYVHDDMPEHLNFYEATHVPKRLIQVKKTIIPQGYVYVLGDNSANSEDSRVIGPVPIKDIIGKAIFPRKMITYTSKF